jgi:hypothetical protein
VNSEICEHQGFLKIIIYTFLILEHAKNNHIERR